MKWGVWYEGSSVEVVSDGLSAFRREKAYRSCGYADAVAVWSCDGRLWWPVDRGSVVRPDPLPPAQGGWWYRRWCGGKFRRRKNDERRQASQASTVRGTNAPRPR